MNINKKKFYQSIINEVLEQHGKDNFTYRLFGERLKVSKQRAKQIVDHFHLDIPRYDYFASKECADLKKLIQSNEVAQYTLQMLYEDRYQKFLPKNFINDLVIASEKSVLSLSNTAIYKEFFKNTKTEEKTKRELFAEVQAMFPHRKFNFSSFCSDIDEGKIPFRRNKKEFFNRKHLASRLRYEELTLLISNFLSSTSTNPSLYAMGELHLLYEEFAKINGKPSIDYILFRVNNMKNKISVARTKPMALLKRMLSLGIDLKGLESKEMADMHNAQYKRFPIVPKMLNHYGIQSQLFKS